MTFADFSNRLHDVIRAIGTRFPVFWRYQLAGWLAFEVIAILLTAVTLGSFWSAVVTSVVREGTAFLLTVGMRPFYRRVYHERAPVWRIAAAILVTCLAAGALLSAVALGWERVAIPEHANLFGPKAVSRLWYFCTSIFVGWSLLYFGLRLTTDIRERNVRLARAEAARKDAELQMLRSQLNPHFLFNALTAIRSGVISRDPELAAVVQNLADYLRFSLEHAGKSMVPIGDEFDAMNDYLSVQKARFGNDLEFECQIDEQVRATLTPGILLQPLVENAIKYGRRTSALPLRVSVRVGSDENRSLSLRVANTGKWVESNGASTHIGLSNLRHRLALLYQDRCRFDAEERDASVVVTIKIPTRS